jgi:dCTP deaminase
MAEKRASGTPLLHCGLTHMTDPGFAPSGFWSGEKLLANRHIIDPFSEAQIDCNSYTLRMGDSFYCTAGEDTNNEPKKTILSSRECFLIPLGQFAYLLSKEVIEVPHDTMAFISMRHQSSFRD